MFGLGSINNAMNKLGKVADIQATKLLVVAVADLKDFQEKSKLSAEEIKETVQLVNDLDDI